MQEYTPPDTKATRVEYGWRYIFTRMVPTAIIVFFILFTFFPDFGSPVSNLRRLGQGDARLSSEQQKQSALTVATGLQQLQASGQLGSYLQVSGGGTNGQTLSWNEQLHLLTISNGNTVDLGSLVTAGEQTLTKSGNTLGLEGSATTVDLASYLDNTDAQILSLAGSTITISGGNSINLAPINTDSQNLSLSGTTLNISGGAGVDIASINTDVLAGLSCSAGQVVQWNGSAWGCASPAASSDAQTLTLAGNNLSILNGNSVSLAGYLDNTDNQALSLGGNTLSLVNGGSVNLAAYLDNTDVLASLACGAGQIAKWNGSAWACAADNDTTTNESQVDAWVANNGYLTSEVDGSTSNELQTLSWNGGTHILTISSGNTADLGSLLDNTDAQAISRTGNTISITGSASTIDLSPYLDNTDAQAISKTGNTLSITGNASTVDLASYLDNTDSQTLGLAGTTLTVSGGNSIDLAPINTDAQTLSLAGTNLSVSGGNTINIASINTDVLAGLSCTTNQIAKWNGSAWACAADVDTVLNEAQVDAYANNNGYLTSEVDGSITNEIQSLSLVADVLSVSGGNSVNLAPYLDNTDSQALSLGGNTLSLVNGGSVNLAAYLDNTDVLASLSCSNNQIPKWNGSAWTCAADVDTVLNEAQVDAYANNNGYLTSEVDGSTSNELQTLTWNSGTHILTISSGNTADLGSLLDNTDAQAISKTGNTLSITGNASTVDLASYLDNTDSQTLGLAGTTLTVSGGNSIDLAPINTDSQNLSLTGTTLNISGGTGVDIASINTDVLAGLSCSTNQIAKWNGSAWACAADVDTDTDAQTLSLASDNLSILNGNSVSLAGYLDNTDSQTLSYNTGTHVLSISGGNTQDLSNLLDNTDAQAISRTGNTVSITGNASTVDLTPYLDNTDVLASLSCSNNQIAKWNSSSWACAADVDTVLNEAQVDAYASNNGYLTSEVDGSTTNEIQDLSKTGDTLSLSGDGTTVDLSGYLDNTDVLASLSCSNTQIAKWNGSAWACAADVDTVLTEGQVDTYVSNNGYLTSEVDGSTSNELQDLNLSSNTLTITGLGSPTNINLATYLDNTDALAALSCIDGKIVKRVAGVWACGDDTDTQLSEAQVDTYVSNNGYLTSEVDGSTTNELQNLFGTIATPDANNPSADTTNDTLTLANGSGVAITSNGATDTITIAATLGTSISNAEIDDATLTFSKLASNSCNSGEVVKFNGSAWVCGADNDTILSEATVESYIFDADNTGTLSSGTLALSSLSYTGTLGDTNVADALTISSAGSVDDAALSATVTKLGQTIESSEITNGTVTGTDLASATIQFSNIAQNGCSTNDIMKWNGSAWACAVDVDTVLNEAQVDAYANNNGYLTSEVDGSTTNELQNIFQTIATPDTNNPSADTTTDTLTLANGSGVAITSNGATDTITIAATLGTDIVSGEIVDGTIQNVDIADSTIANTKLANSNLTVSAGTGLTGGGAVSLGGTVTLNLANDFGASIDSSEITDGTIVSGDIFDGTVANADLANSSLTVSAGSGLANGGSVALGGTTTLNIGAGNGITVNADDIAVRAAASADALSATTSSGSGLEVLTSGVALLQGCADTQVLKWNETTDVWACANDVDTQPSEATIEAYIFDADNTGTISSGTFALGSLSYTGALTDTNISDTLTVGATSTVSDSALSANVTKLGAAIESSEITDATIAAADIAPDALDFTELKDAMALDTATTIALGANNFNVNLDSTGTFNVQDGGTSVLSVLANGTFRFQNSADSATSFVVNDAASLPMLTVDTTANAVQVGTLVDDAADVLLVLDGVSGADPTGIAGGMYYNTTNSKFRCYEGGAWKDCIATGYSINVLALSTSPVDTTVNYFGAVPRATTATAARSKVYIPKAGTIKYSSISVYCTTAGTAENWTLAIRKNNTTDTNIATLGVSAAERIFTNNALSISVAAGDYIEIKSTPPVWATNPVGCTFGGTVYIE